jgi:hypothetical protein
MIAVAGKSVVAAKLLIHFFPFVSSHCGEMRE